MNTISGVLQCVKGASLHSRQYFLSLYVRHEQRFSQQSCKYGIIENVTIPTSCAQQDVELAPWCWSCLVSMLACTIKNDMLVVFLMSWNKWQAYICAVKYFWRDCVGGREGKRGRGDGGNCLRACYITAE